MLTAAPERAALPVLLYNDECNVCRRIARWVTKAARTGSADTATSVEAPGNATLDVRPIGDDPQALRSLNPRLDIWDAYATIHLLMPDATMRTGGDAVAEVFRRIPVARWFSWTFGISIFGFRPFQIVLNGGYWLLADIRPLLGCESCGTPSGWLKPLYATVESIKAKRRKTRLARPTAHFTGRS